ncbi:MAG TPA: YccF domain-containing protein [Salinivirga sp.]|uniref:YccF domain-containing protein n=1 Tax=Salinivirga sp. TaxID=1970192 RepID=UPI002B49F499|nr:YccF domain-containing protein [Salinivirga sp.]HKK58728.1 YccF domain-containing protein [Salinivirga sp.]
MRLLGNILWHFPFLGFIDAAVTFLIGGFLVITVVGMPLGFGLIQLSKFLLAPFTHEMVDKKTLDSKQNELWRLFGIFVWIVYFPVGLLITLITIVKIAGLFITIVGIPVALVMAKSLGTIFNPVDKVCVTHLRP